MTQPKGVKEFAMEMKGTDVQQKIDEDDMARLGKVPVLKVCSSNNV